MADTDHQTTGPDEIKHLNNCITHAMTELREAVARDVFRTQTDFVGRIRQVTCEIDDLFDQKTAAELDSIEFQDREELDEKLMALAALCVACAVLCREEPLP